MAEYTGEDVERDLAAAERLSIEAAENTIRMAQYQALHERIEDYTVWLIEMGYVAKRAINPADDGSDEHLFELVEQYLDEVTEHELHTAVDQILRPDMTEFMVEDSIGRERPQF